LGEGSGEIEYCTGQGSSDQGETDLIGSGTEEDRGGAEGAMGQGESREEKRLAVSSLSSRSGHGITCAGLDLSFLVPFHSCRKR